MNKKRGAQVWVDWRL